MPNNEVARYADVAMYRAEPMPIGGPYVTIINATPNPLRTMAAAVGLYKGEVHHGVVSVSQEQAKLAQADMTATALKAGLEFIDFHFFIEGVSRALANQMVRQRTAVFVQESLRFAVKDGETISDETVVPPSIAALKEDDPRRVRWSDGLTAIAEVYDGLVASGIPAEDARGLLPLNLTTRIHYKTSLRGLMEHAGLRLCTQAQFEWRKLWTKIVEEIWHYESRGMGWSPHAESDGWEFQKITELFRPICYRTGKCEFMASADRHCVIRDRVQAHAANGEPSSEWSDIGASEWLVNPSAAIRRQ